MSSVIVYFYHAFFHGIDDEEFGGTWELVKEGMMTSFALFLVRSVAIMKCPQGFPLENKIHHSFLTTSKSMLHCPWGNLYNELNSQGGLSTI